MPTDANAHDPLSGSGACQSKKYGLDGDFDGKADGDADCRSRSSCGYRGLLRKKDCFGERGEYGTNGDGKTHNDGHDKHYVERTREPSRPCLIFATAYFVLSRDELIVRYFKYGHASSAAEARATQAVDAISRH